MQPKSAEGHSYGDTPITNPEVDESDENKGEEEEGTSKRMTV